MNREMVFHFDDSDVKEALLRYLIHKKPNLSFLTPKALEKAKLEHYRGCGVRDPNNTMLKIQLDDENA